MTHVNTSKAESSYVYYTALLLNSQPQITSSDMGASFFETVGKKFFFFEDENFYIYIFANQYVLSHTFSKLHI